MTFEVHSYNKGHEQFDSLTSAFYAYSQNKEAHRLLFVLPTGEVMKIEDKKVKLKAHGTEVILK